MFHVGQKVVCVNDGPSKFTGLATNVRAGTVYTVSWIGYHDVHPIVLLKEIDPIGHYSFDAHRFRPVVERKTDISIFQAMLNPKHEQVSA